MESTAGGGEQMAELDVRKLAAKIFNNHSGAGAGGPAAGAPANDTASASDADLTGASSLLLLSDSMKDVQVVATATPALADV
jgi:hypothetical protein